MLTHNNTYTVPDEGLPIKQDLDIFYGKGTPSSQPESLQVACWCLSCQLPKTRNDQNSSLKMDQADSETY